MTPGNSCQPGIYRSLPERTDLTARRQSRGLILVKGSKGLLVVRKMFCNVIKFMLHNSGSRAKPLIVKDSFFFQVPFQIDNHRSTDFGVGINAF